MQGKILVQLEQTPDAGIRLRWQLSGSADARLQSADFEEFRRWLLTLQSGNSGVLRAVLLLSGEQVVSRPVVFAANEKKHLQKLLPFMLESQLAVDLSQVHVAYALSKDPQTESDQQTALVAYTDKKQLQWRIDELESLGLEVEEVFSIPAILPADHADWRLLLDGDICHLHVGNVLCTSIQTEMVTTLIDVAITELIPHTNAATLTVLVNAVQWDSPLAMESTPSQQHARKLVQSLNEHAGLKAAGIQICHQLVENAWTSLNRNHKHAVNLRQGALAAPLRLAKYWRQWRVPAIAAMLAMSAVLVTAIVETQINQYRLRALESRIEQRYREVMPEGVLVDAAQQLSAQVSQRRNAGASQSLISMLDAMLEPFENAESLSLHRLSYNSSPQSGGPGTEIQLNISATSTAEILRLSENLTVAGWSAQAQNISRVGDSQQANLLVRGNGL